MSKKNQVNKQQVTKQAPKYSTPVASQSILDVLDNWFARNANTIFWIALISTVLFGLLLFDVKISEGGDDSEYIVGAKKFLEGKRFPTWHGSFYPIFLSLPMAIFGVSVISFKVISYFLMIGHLVLLFYGLKNRIPATLLMFTMLITGINGHILYFASSTYSEALYLFLQSGTIFFFLKLVDNFTKENEKSIKIHWKYWMIFGLFMFMLSITRNVGVGVILSVLFYFIVNKQYYPALYSVGVFFIYQIPYNIYKIAFWKINQTGYESQFSQMFWKHPYDKTQGKEDLAGFFIRFWDNSNLYLSKHFFKILGIRGLDSVELSSSVSLLVYAIFILALVYVWKRNKYLFFIAAYLAVGIGATFFTQQKQWDQVRLILIYVPLSLIFLMYGFYELAKEKMFKILQIILPIVFVVLIFTSFGQTGTLIQKNIPILRKNLKGDLLYGFTPDWVNYLKASKWAASNLPKDSLVACRKSSISFIYGDGRDFYGITRFPAINVDTIYKQLKIKNSGFFAVDTKYWQQQTAAVRFKLSPYIRVVLNHPEMGLFGIYQAPDSIRDNAFNAFKKLGIKGDRSADSLVQVMRKKGLTDAYGVYPDSLVHYLKKNKIAYILDGSLRKFPKEKTPYTINTVSRYLYFIEMKYMGMFSKVYQEGMDDGEPAMIYKVNK